MKIRLKIRSLEAPQIFKSPEAAVNWTVEIWLQMHCWSWSLTKKHIDEKEWGKRNIIYK